MRIYSAIDKKVFKGKLPGGAPKESKKSVSTKSKPFVPADYKAPQITKEQAAKYRAEEQEVYTQTGYTGGRSYNIPTKKGGITQEDIQNARRDSTIIPTTVEGREAFIEAEQKNLRTQEFRRDVGEVLSYPERKIRQGAEFLNKIPEADIVFTPFGGFDVRAKSPLDFVAPSTSDVFDSMIGTPKETAPKIIGGGTALNIGSFFIPYVQIGRGLSAGSYATGQTTARGTQYIKDEPLEFGTSMIVGVGAGVKAVQGVKSIKFAHDLKNAKTVFGAEILPKGDKLKGAVFAETTVGKQKFYSVSEQLYKPSGGEAAGVGRGYAFSSRPGNTQIVSFKNIGGGKLIGKARGVKEFSDDFVNVKMFSGEGQGVIGKTITKGFKSRQIKSGLGVRGYRTDYKVQDIVDIKIDKIVGKLTKTSRSGVNQFVGGKPEKLRIYKQGGMQLLTKPNVKGLISTKPQDIGIKMGRIGSQYLLPKSLQQNVLGQVAGQQSIVKAFQPSFKPFDLGLGIGTVSALSKSKTPKRTRPVAQLEQPTQTTTPITTQTQEIIQVPKTRDRMFQTLGQTNFVKPRSKQRSVPSLGSASVITPRDIDRTAITTTTTQRTGLRQTPKTDNPFTPITFTPPRFDFLPGGGIPILPFPPIGGGGFGKKYYTGKRKLKRTPSFAAAVLGITAPKPGKLEFTGLVERPLLSSGKKIRKKKKKRKK